MTLDSRVSIEDPETGSLNEYTLVLPGELVVDHGVDRLSVLAPLGWEILGRREGDWVQFRVPATGGDGLGSRWIHFQPEAERAQAYPRGANHPHGAHREHAMHPEYPLERLCSHLYEPFQLTFARHAEQVLREEDEVELEATHKGLVLRGETEAAFEHSVQLLRNYYGNQIDVGPAAVRYHKGTTVEEPLMGLRVNCSPEHFEVVAADLNIRNAVIVASHIGPTRAEIRAGGPPCEAAGVCRAADTAHLGNGPQRDVVEPLRPSGNAMPDDTAA